MPQRSDLEKERLATVDGRTARDINHHIPCFNNLSLRIFLRSPACEDIIGGEQWTLHLVVRARFLRLDGAHAASADRQFSVDDGRLSRETGKIFSRFEAIRRKRILDVAVGINGFISTVPGLTAPQLVTS